MVTKRNRTATPRASTDGRRAQPTTHLKFSPTILARLGEELIPDPDQGIVELVKNAYDADAKRCDVLLTDVDRAGGSIQIADDGDGMTRDDITSGWLVIGKSAKEARGVTRLGRSPVGDKGLGRLAALRLGRTTDLETMPRKEPGAVHHVAIDWSRFDEAATVEEVPIAIDSSSRHAGWKQGTKIHITDLTVQLRKRDIQRLARSLVLLADPFATKQGFRPRLLIPEYKELEALVQEGYLKYADFRVEAELDSKGHATAVAFDGRGVELWRATHHDMAETREPYAAPAARFEAWLFVLDGVRYTNRPVGVNEVKQWLKVVGGVHVYLRGIRVRPYGDEGHDWLDLNLARNRNPELRPSTGTIVGRVVVSDPGVELLEKTDRSGFVENEQFVSLRSFVQDAMNWLAQERLRERESSREKDKGRANVRTQHARRSLDKVIAVLPPRYREEVETAVQRLARAQSVQAQDLRSEIQLYRTMATIGTTLAVFAHDSVTPIHNVKQNLKSLQKRIREDVKESVYAQRFARLFATASDATATIEGFAALPVRLLEKEKRRIRDVDVNMVAERIISLFSYLESDYDATFKAEVTESPVFVRASEAAVESIIVNLVTNALTALTLEGATKKSRSIVVRTEEAGERVVIRVLDTGPGIAMRLSDIWLPGRTTTDLGSGIGLTIVRDITVELGGEVGALPKGEYGGAEVWSSIPRTAKK